MLAAAFNVGRLWEGESSFLTLPKCLTSQPALNRIARDFNLMSLAPYQGEFDDLLRQGEGVRFLQTDDRMTYVLWIRHH